MRRRGKGEQTKKIRSHKQKFWGKIYAQKALWLDSKIEKANVGIPVYNQYLKIQTHYLIVSNCQDYNSWPNSANVSRCKLILKFVQYDQIKIAKCV